MKNIYIECKECKNTIIELPKISICYDCQDKLADFIDEIIKFFKKCPKCGIELTSDEDILSRVLFDTDNYAIILEELKSAENSIVFISPYVKLPRNIERILQSKVDSGIEISFYISSEEKSEVVTKLENLGIQVFSINNLHSKVYIFDNKTAVISSLNFQTSSIEKNFELGMLVTDAHELEKLKEYIEELKKYQAYTGESHEGLPISCPECGKILVLHSNDDKQFYGCSNYQERNCKFTVPFELIEKVNQTKGLEIFKSPKMNSTYKIAYEDEKITIRRESNS